LVGGAGFEPATPGL